MDMSRIESSLTRLEARLQAIIEGESAKDGIPRKFHNQLLRGLIRAMQAEVNKEQGEVDLDDVTPAAPDQYTLVLPSAQAQMLLSHPSELDRLARQLESSAAQSGFRLHASPILRIVADPTAQELHVLCERGQAGVEDSFTINLGQMPDENGNPPAEITPNAFLIVNGLDTFPLALPVINIGSDAANQLILENPSVSRMHAQLRLISGRYFIFDLDSTSGTFINGVAVSSHVLNPGDVILIAGVPLVYGQETIKLGGYTRELPVDPQPPSLEIL
jgi:hypothetical protein